MNQSFKYNEDAKYRVGGVYEPSHQFSLVHQTITIKKVKVLMFAFQIYGLSINYLK